MAYSSGATGGGAKTIGESLTAIEVSSFTNYLRRVIIVLLDGAEEDNPGALDVALKDGAAMECMKKFLSDPQIPVLLVQRSAAKDENEEGTVTEDKVTVVYNITSDLKFFSAEVSSVVVVKRGRVVEADKNFASQLHLMNLSDGSPYETLHAFISKAVAPYFKSYVRASGKADRNGDKMTPLVEKKIEELEMELFRCQPNIEIPEIILNVHPTVRTVIQKCREEGRTAKVTDFEGFLGNIHFLDSVESGVSQWTKEIQKVTKLDRDPSSGTALQEISFWPSLERELLRIQEKRESIETALTLDILKHRKRFHATVGFDRDTGLQEALAKVNDYNQLMKNFSLDELLLAKNLEHIPGALIAIFAHLRKIRATKYPCARALRFIEAISRDLSTQLIKILDTTSLMQIPLKDLEKVMILCRKIFDTWSDEYDRFQGLLHDILMKRREENLRLSWKVDCNHKKLLPRLEQIRKFRRQHEQLRWAILRVLRPAAVTSLPVLMTVDEAEHLREPLTLDAVDAIEEEVNMIFNDVKEACWFDVSREETEAQEAAFKRYDSIIDRIAVTYVTAMEMTKNTARMFRILSRCDTLFIRSNLQIRLIQRVKDNVESLRKKLEIPYSESMACRMSSGRDLPPVAGYIVWARQIQRQLNTSMHTIKVALGRGWENHEEGRKLKAVVDHLSAQLDTEQVFEDWTSKVKNNLFDKRKKILCIESDERSRQTGKGWKVDFSPEDITLVKEVRSLKWLGYRVPLAIVFNAQRVDQCHPFAILLVDIVKTYERTCDMVEDRPGIVPLVAGMCAKVRERLMDGIFLTWDSSNLDPYVYKMAKKTLQFQNKVDHLLMVEEQIDMEVKALDTCAYSHDTLSEVLTSIQKHVDDLGLHQYSNLPQWFLRLDQQVEARLATRLKAGLKAFEKLVRDQDVDNMDTDASVQLTGGEGKLKKFVHELRIANQVMSLSPPIEEFRVNIFRELHSCEAVITTLPRITLARHQVEEDAPSVSEAHYKNLLTKIPDVQEALHEVYEMIEKIVRDVDGYVGVWLDYMPRFNLQVDHLYVELDRSVPKWREVLEDIKSSRTTLDNLDASKDFGPIKIDVGKVQSELSLQYDSLLKEVIGKYENVFGTEMQEFRSPVSETDLDQSRLLKEKEVRIHDLESYIGDLESYTDDLESFIDDLNSQSHLLMTNESSTSPARFFSARQTDLSSSFRLSDPETTDGSFYDAMSNVSACD